MTTPRDYFDVNAEPSNFRGGFEPDPSEQTVQPIDGSEDEISTIRDFVSNEPAFTGELKQAHLGQWLIEKRAQCTLEGNITVTLVAALLAGLFAIVGALFESTNASLTLNPIVRKIVYILYMFLYGPIVEELLKQSGMIYLLEKKPYRIFSIWQFLCAAVISALVFSAIENLLYINFYADSERLNDLQAFAAYRWKYCTLLHVTCSIVASFGLIRVWKKQQADGRAADLSHGFWLFVAAMAVHGLYNLTVVLVGPEF